MMECEKERGRILVARKNAAMEGEGNQKVQLQKGEHSWKERIREKALVLLVQEGQSKKKGGT